MGTLASRVYVLRGDPWAKPAGESQSMGFLYEWMRSGVLRMRGVARRAPRRNPGRRKADAIVEWRIVRG
jgi:hypothetical protein